MGQVTYNQFIRIDTPFSFGDRLTLANICLVGQMINARRWGCPTSDFPRLEEIDARAIPAVHQGLFNDTDISIGLKRSAKRTAEALRLGWCHGHG